MPEGTIRLPQLPLTFKHLFNYVTKACIMV